MVLPRAIAIPWIRNSWWTAGPRSWGWRAGRDLTDREASFVAAEYLRERLEQEDERPLYDVSAGELERLIEKIGIR